MECFKALKEYFWPHNKELYLHESFIISKNKLLFLRMFLFLFSFGIYSMTNILNGSFYKSYMYLTYWGEVLTMLTFFTLLIDNILYMQDYYKENQSSHLSRAAHIIFETAFSYELSIVLLYWLAVYPSSKDEKNSLFYTTNILVHGFCFILLWIENIFNFIEFFPRHMFIVTFIGIAYIIDNVIVVFCINFDTVYSVLTWTDVMSYIYVIGCLIVALLHFYLGMMIFKRYKWKKWGKIIIKKNDMQNSPGSLEMEKKSSLKNEDN